MPDYELSDISAKYQQDSSDSGSRRSDVMYVSTAKAFICLLLAIAVAVGVGIIVHFAGPGRTIECNCNYPTPAPTTPGPSGGNAAAIEQCKDWAEEGNADICSACPTAPTPTPCPTTTQAPATTHAQTTTSAATVTTSSMVTTTAPPKVTDVRLPLALNPLLYTVELQPHMYGSNKDEFFFNGSVTIKLRCDISTNNITLHTNKLNYTGEIHIYRENDIITNLYKEHEFDADRQFIILMTTEELIAGNNYIVEVTQFTGPLKDDLTGLYLSSYTRDNETIYIATTQMQPTDARKTFPCMDEPAIKAEFEITLVRKSHMVAISNMPIVSNETRSDDWVADKFQKTEIMSTYLLAFIICDFEYKENYTKNNVLYRAWARPEAVNQANYSLEIGVHILDYFEDFFNVTYPLPKQDMIAIPDFAAGAMENWGLITYRETAMLYEPGVSSEGNKQRVAVVVSHELAHQWFGNLVTPSWWDDLWLNEGFASYVEYMGVDDYHKDWKMFDQFVVSDLQSVFDFDGLISSHPVYVPVAHPDEINEIFDRISYAKGASIIRMMRFFLGDEVFQKGLTNYLNNLAYGAAFHDDLWYALGNQSVVENHKFTNVKEIMDTWVLQMNYPVIHVKNLGGGQLSITQERYLQDPNATDPKVYTSPFNYTWHVPFTYATSLNPKFDVTAEDIVMLQRNTESETITNVASIPEPVDNNWVLGNPMQYGYYRVNYDEQNWNALINQLRTNHTVIHPINRAQIINDAWRLAGSGALDMRIALRTTEYLGNEREYVPWSAADTQLSYVDSMLARNSVYGSFQKFMKSKTTSAFEELTMNNTGATHLESYMRSTISGLACSYGIQECIDTSKDLFKQWMDTDVNPIDPGLKSTVYCTAVAEGGIDEWEFVLEKYRVENVAAEKVRLLHALSCSKETWILSRYLEMAIEENGVIRKQDSVSVIVYISRNTIGRSLAWDFFRDKWDQLLAFYGESSFSLTNLVGGVTNSFNTQLDLDQLQAFMESKDNLGSGKRAFDQALEKTQSNIMWMNANVPVIREWLTQQGF